MKYFAFLVVLSFGLNAKVLDKILAIVDDNMITLSEIQRVQDNLDARKTISPILYSKNKYSQQEITELLLQGFLVRTNLTESGYVVSDDQVELQIKETEKNLGVNREYLLKFLSSNNLTFDEYFEIIRETLEFNIFHTKVIYPLISITEQEIKNYFYRENASSKSLAFRYTLVDFFLPAKTVNKEMLTTFTNVMTKFNKDGILPNNFKNIESKAIEDITDEGLEVNLKKLLKNTDEGGFSSPILMDHQYHVFYVKNKNLVESEEFQKSKESIRAKIFQTHSENMIGLWFKRVQNKHYIKYFL